MAIAALIIVGVLLVSSTLIASLLVQRRAEQRESHAELVAGEQRYQDDDYSRRLKKVLRTRLSHELRTPLNSIITLSQLLIEDQGRALSLEQRRYIEVIRRNG